MFIINDFKPFSHGTSHCFCRERPFNIGQHFRRSWPTYNETIKFKKLNYLKKGKRYVMFDDIQYPICVHSTSGSWAWISKNIKGQYLESHKIPLFEKDKTFKRKTNTFLFFVIFNFVEEMSFFDLPYTKYILRRRSKIIATNVKEIGHCEIVLRGPTFCIKWAIDDRFWVISLCLIVRLFLEMLTH